MATGALFDIEVDDVLGASEAVVELLGLAGPELLALGIGNQERCGDPRFGSSPSL